MKEIKKNLKDLCQSFLHFITYSQKLSSHSLKAYKTDLQDIFEFNDLSPKQKLDFIIIQNKKKLEKQTKLLIEKNTNKQFKLANSTRSRKLAVIRSFIKWMANNNYIEEDFRFLFKSPKISYRVPSFLSVDEIFTILEMFKTDKVKAKDKALFFLLYGAGLRISEACQLKTKEINWSDSTLQITGKGNKQRLVSLPEQAFNQIKHLKSNTPYLFGKKALSKRKAYDIIKAIGKKAGLLKPLNPHALRHSFATHMLLGGSNLRTVQELLGHKSLTATQKYTHLDLTHLSKTLENFHPFNIS
ncbi:MAG: tyrosine-type recombinase/integrase [Bdellovibrionaceae bacterium]|nr:tyrosine-type recombinase/integrase [Pseudobdellovibrionaceae bacterium]